MPDEGLLCDVLWSDPEPNQKGWGENDRGVSFTFGTDVVTKFLNRHDLDLVRLEDSSRPRAMHTTALAAASCRLRVRPERAAISVSCADTVGRVCTGVPCPPGSRGWLRVLR